MANKKSNKLTIIIASIAVILLIGGLVYYFTLTTKPSVPQESTSEDGSVSLGATFYDADGNPISPLIRQSLIGGIFPEIAYMSFLIEARNSGNVPLTNVRLTGTSVPLNENLGPNNPAAFTTLSVAENTLREYRKTNNACTIETNCDAKEDCKNTQCLINITFYETANAATPNSVSFSTSLIADYVDAFGTPAVTPGAAVALTYDIRGVRCSPGNEPFNQSILSCRAAPNQPQYCTRVTGPIELGYINNATACGCPAGQEPAPDGLECQVITCPNSGGTPINTCSLDTFNPLTRTKQFCRSDRILEDRCYQCGTLPNPWLTACQLSANGNPATSCNPATTGVFSICGFSDVGGIGGAIQQG